MGRSYNFSAEPISFVPSGWGGNDGNWSTFAIGIGTEPQHFHFLVALDQDKLLVPLPNYCFNTAIQNRGSRRGVLPFDGNSSLGFQRNRSSTWVTDALLSNTGNDVLILGREDDSKSLGFTDIKGVELSDPWMGSVGLRPIPISANHHSFKTHQPTLIQDIWFSGFIRSISLGYTAGASYREFQ
jgi:hypothetical protein